ncbi:MAG: hypothetical protein D6698_00255 [Gammaproteobacteria bacterium]|nr:MAG: hypothetical protein D6698_00255 [Gammaproteobacteria bacterium]
MKRIIISIFGVLCITINSGEMALAQSAGGVGPETSPLQGGIFDRFKKDEDRSFFWNRGSHFQTENEAVPVGEDGIHDPAVGSMNILQEPSQAMKGFPRDRSGVIDWVKVLDQGLINPRMTKDGVTGLESGMFVADFDVILTDTASMPNVRFPHRPHTMWLTCSNCHPAIFIPKAGSNPISMSAIIRGQYCGVCHGKVAFPPTKNCGRCHSVPQSSIRKKLGIKKYRNR